MAGAGGWGGGGPPPAGPQFNARRRYDAASTCFEAVVPRMCPALQAQRKKVVNRVVEGEGLAAIAWPACSPTQGWSNITKRKRPAARFRREPRTRGQCFRRGRHGIGLRGTDDVAVHHRA